jgi:hypothetical protein
MLTQLIQHPILHLWATESAVGIVGGPEQFEVEGDLALVPHAMHLVGLSFRSSKRRQEQAGQNCDNRDDHQQFDEGKARTIFIPVGFYAWCSHSHCWHELRGILARTRGILGLAVRQKCLHRRQLVCPGDSLFVKATRGTQTIADQTLRV